jgi:hypothetical protein
MLAAATLSAADLPTGESLLDKYVEVTGGKKAYAARKTEIAHGTVEYAAMGIKGKMTRWASDAGEYRLTMEIPGIGKMDAGVTKGVAWERSDLLGPRVKDGQERSEAVREAKLNSNALWRELYKSVETTGEETVNGEPCYKLTLIPTDGEPETMFLSKKTGLALKMAVTANTQLGALTAEILFDDYKTFGGILTPAKITEKTAGQEITITVDSVEVNPEIPASQFAMPADVVALTDKGPKI